MTPITLHLTPAGDAFTARPARSLTSATADYLRLHRADILALLLRGDALSTRELPQSFWDMQFPPVDPTVSAALCRALCRDDAALVAQ